MKLNWVPKTITNIALIALIVAPIGHRFAQAQPSRPVNDRAAQVTLPSYFPVFGDFDGDLLLDQAEPHSAGSHQCIRVRFGNSLESHLEFGARPRVTGALLARDINHDDIADLIWVYHSTSEPPVVWLGDGLGHFAKSDEQSANADLRSILFDNGDPLLAGEVSDERACVAPHLVSSELPRAHNLENNIPKDPVITGRDRGRDLWLFLSYLRERGPPSYNLFV